MSSEHPITQYRARHGLSQSDFGALLGVSDAAVSRWETGQRVPLMAMMWRIEAATGGEVTFAELAALARAEGEKA
jgi:transcriptional regulator with XRE-family HTH domain